MFSVEDLILHYEKYSDDELFEMNANLNTYSEEAKRAFNAVLSKKGGLEGLIKRQTDKKIISDEIQRIQNEVKTLNHPDVDVSFIQKLITSDILPASTLNEIIDTAYAELALVREDEKIKPRTILGSIIGGIVSSLVGGVLWGLQLIYSKRIFTIFLIGLAILCYGIVKVSTKQSIKNRGVFIATALSIIIAILIGQLLYKIIGYKG